MKRDHSLDKTATLTIMLITIIAIIALLYLLRPTTGDFRTTPGEIDAPKTPVRNDSTLTTPASANPRY